MQTIQRNKNSIYYDIIITKDLKQNQLIKIVWL